MRKRPHISQFFLFLTLTVILTFPTIIIIPTSTVNAQDSNQIESASLVLTLNSTKEIYRLGEPASLYGNVTLNGSPVNNSLVAIEIDPPTPAGTLVFRTTNTSENPSQSLSATIMHFIPITSIEDPTPKYIFSASNFAYFNFTVKNNLDETIPALLTVTIFDNISTPIGYGLYQTEIAPNGYVASRLPIYIPSTTPTCNVTAYANVYSNYPRENGIAYCPENSTTITIIGSAPGGGENVPITPAPPGSYNYTYRLPQKPGGNCTAYATTWRETETAFAKISFITATLFIDDDQPADFNTIQAAINAAENGQSLYVYNGEYEENIVINKTLWIIGEYSNTPTIDGQGLGKVVSITADSVTLTNFRIERSSTTPTQDYAIYIISSYNTITQNLITNNGNGIWQNSTGNKISDNIITNSIRKGLILQNSSGNTISDNTIKLCQDNAIELMSSSNNIFTNNRIENFSKDVKLYYSNYNTFSENIIANSTTGGIRLDYSNFSLFTSNNIFKNYYGIRLGYSNNNTITQNTIIQNTYYGVLLDISHNNTISKNKIEQNNIGIWFSNALSNKIYNCNMINPTQIIIDASRNTFNDAYPTGGNYWSGYSGPDKYKGPNQDQIGSDGMIDVPREFDPNNIDSYPLLKYYGKPDIAITNVTLSKTLVALGFNMRIYVYVINYNIDPATFMIYFFGNGTILATKFATLSGRSYTTVSYSWNTTYSTLGNYTISAYATQVAGETYISDNNFVDGNAEVYPLLGDLNTDGKVGPSDFYTFARAYGSRLGQSNYQPNCDFSDNDWIDPKDFYYFARNYGKSI